MSFLCVIVITVCKELITFSSCISLLFRPATIIFMAKITFLSLSPQVLGSEKTVDISRRYSWFPAKWRLRIDYRNSILMTCDCPDLDSDTSSVWNFWAPSSDFVSRGNQRLRREMSAILSGDQFLRLASIRTKTLYRIKVILFLKFRIISFWVTAHLPLPYANILP